MRLDEVIYEVSNDLNDQVPGHEYTRWTVAQLQSYIREVLIGVSLRLKDLFTENMVVKVQPGAGWQKACDCTDILRIVGESDAAGDVLRYLSRSRDVEQNTWAGAVARCRVHPKDYTMYGYTINSLSSDQFKIDPPVPPGVAKYVLIECYKQPDSMSLAGNVPDEAVAIVKQWALYRALSVDSENNPVIIQLAQTHYKAYSELLNAAVLEREMSKRDADNLRAVPKPPAD